MGLSAFGLDDRQQGLAGEVQVLWARFAGRQLQCDGDHQDRRDQGESLRESAAALFRLVERSPRAPLSRVVLLGGRTLQRLLSLVFWATMGSW